jgi:DNA-binding FadR family transcriptional regulator
MPGLRIAGIDSHDLDLYDEARRFPGRAMTDETAPPDAPFRNLAKRGNLVSMLTESLEREIREGRYRPGDQLPTESRLATTAGVSRTVVREAVASLRAAGLVETRQGAGAFVLEGSRPLTTLPRIGRHDLEDIIAVLELRLAVEVEAAALAATRRSDEDLARIDRALDHFDTNRRLDTTGLDSDLDFHQSLAAATKNPYFGQFLSGLGRSAVPRSRLKRDGRDVKNLDDYLRFVQLEHRAIRNAVEARDAALAAAAMRAHLAGSRSRYSEMLGDTNSDG